MFRKVKNYDLDKLVSLKNYRRLHTGHGNLDVTYKIVDTVLGTTVNYL